MFKYKKSLSLSIWVFVIVSLFLGFMQWKMETPLILLERFLENGGWIEVLFIALYGAILVYKMQDPAGSSRWRLLSWNIFTIVFFSQLILGLIADKRFLMTGELHLPVPMMIMGGPVYRGELSIMTFLFLSTIIVTGPAWCSHLCYFGSLDNLISNGRKPKRKPIKNLLALKLSVMAMVIVVILLLRWLNASLLLATLFGAGFGIIGLVIIFLQSRKAGKMIHCLAWCPIGTIVNYGRYINPFRMYIDKESCTLCNICTSKCKYDALSMQDIKGGKPAVTCTLCGDCVGSCHAGSIKYKFFNLQSDKARNLYLILTVSMHSIFLALGRI